MDFDCYTVVLLVTPAEPPQLSEEETDRLQDAHLSHIADLHERIAALQAMQRSLQALVGCCQGDERPDCPILDDLAG